MSLRRAIVAAGTALALAAVAWLFTPAPRGTDALTAGVRSDPAWGDGLTLSIEADERSRSLGRELLDAVAKAGSLQRITIDYPLEESVFPPDFAAPTFLWHDSSSEVDRWLIEVAFERPAARLWVLVPGDPPPRGEIDSRALGEANEVYQPTPYQASARSWRPSAEVWESIKARSVDSPARLTFVGYRAASPESVLSLGRSTLRTSRHPVGAPVFYRDVPLMPTTGKDGVIKPLSEGAVPLIAWRIKDLSRDDSRVLLQDMPTCANCHSFSSDGKTFGMDVDGPDGDKGAYGLVPLEPTTVIQAGQVISWNRFRGKPQGHQIFGFLSRVSPDGKHVITTVNEALYVQNFTNYKFSQVFFPTRGILAVYSRDKGSIEVLPGADDPRYVHCSPVWSPDGETIVFSRAEARDPYVRGLPRATHAGDPNERQIQFDLYRIPFNGGRGGRAEPVRGASANGWSNTFPKISPDGKWIVLTRCKNGLLMRPDGELFILAFAGGEPRKMRCNTPLMNSWHSFSPNGRWLVFSSKSNTPYTQMFLTHIDEAGDDSPAILVENATAANRAVNIPEFVNVRYEGFQRISVPAVDHWRHMKAGAKLAKQGKHRDAVVEFSRALEGEFYDWRSNDWKTHANMSMSLMKLGDVEGAIGHVRKSLELFPNNAEMETNLGYLLAERGENEEAIAHLDRAVRLDPRDARIRCNRAKLRMNLGDEKGGLADFDEAVRLDPTLAEAWTGRAAARMNHSDVVGARSDLDQAIQLDPSSATAWYFRALVREQAGDLRGAADDLERAAMRVTAGSAQAREIEAKRSQLRERLAD